MRGAERVKRPLARRTAALVLAGLGLAGALAAQSAAGILGTKHDLSVNGPGPIKATSETRVCVFCHTPHNATPLSPLWNREVKPTNYTVYTSPTLLSGPLPQPTGPTKLCLTCHDGALAMGAVVNPAGGIAMQNDTLPAYPSGLSNFSTDLSSHHPVSFPYDNALPNPELAPTPPADLVFGDGDELHCTTCHDPHDDQFGEFLAKDNRYSRLCTTCHQITGWEGSAHAISTASVVGILPRPPKTRPTYTTLGEWGCETCHTPHFAPTPEELLNFTDVGPNTFSCTSAGCHSSDPGPAHAPTSGGVSVAAHRTGMADIAGQIRKPSAHHAIPGQVTSVGGPGASGRAANRGAACADCHNPHLATDQPAEAPYASGMLRGASGVDRNGSPVERVTYQYEVCFKCHGDSTPDLAYVPRVVATTNLRLAFEPSNPSYHPVVARGKNFDVPSLPSTLEPGMTPSQMLYCTDCHADDSGVSKGPHGSNYAPILKERYETADGTPESYESYALCYRCHDRNRLLADTSFPRKLGAATGSGGGHSGHLAAGIACAACHDPHGVNLDETPDARASGSHTHLINFDKRIVLPLPSATYPVYQDLGGHTGSCTLVCHGVTHDHATYP